MKRREVCCRKFSFRDLVSNSSVRFRFQNELDFHMFNEKATAEADITVLDLSNLLRLAVVEVG